MESKYYCPDLSEFHIGFEYEVANKEFSDDEEEWGKQKMDIFIQESEWDGKEVRHINVYTSRYFDQLHDLDDGWLAARVKYLDKDDIESLGFVEYDTSKDSAYEWLCRKNGPIETTYYRSDKLCLRKWKDTEEYQNYYYLGYTCEIIHPKTSEKKLRGFEYNGVIRNKSELIQLINNLKRTS